MQERMIVLAPQSVKAEPQVGARLLDWMGCPSRQLHATRPFCAGARVCALQ